MFQIASNDKSNEMYESYSYVPNQPDIIRQEDGEPFFPKEP